MSDYIAGESALGRCSNITAFSDGWRGERRSEFDALDLEDMLQYELRSDASKHVAKIERRQWRVARRGASKDALDFLPLGDAQPDASELHALVRRDLPPRCLSCNGDEWHPPQLPLFGMVGLQCKRVFAPIVMR